MEGDVGNSGAVFAGLPQEGFADVIAIKPSTVRGKGLSDAPLAATDLEALLLSMREQGDQLGRPFSAVSSKLFEGRGSGEGQESVLFGFEFPGITFDIHSRASPRDR